MKISVIIPVFGVEAFIERCATTLLEQTLREVEYIFVDDASPDNSISILEEVIARYPERKAQVRIVRHTANQGLPAARNTGLGYATGEYIFHCDSDDYVEPNMLEELYRTAKEQEADIVWCDWYLTFAQNERYMKQPCYSTPLEALKAQLAGAMKYNVWNKLVRRSLYTDHHIAFPSGYGMGEDMTMMMLFARALKVAYVPKAFYHYVKLNTGAFSQTYSAKHLEEVRYNADRICHYIQVCYGHQLDRELAFLKLEVKFPFLIGDDEEKYRLWTEWYPEANRYICENRYVSARSRLLQWCAWKEQFWAVRLHYLLVIKIVYGIKYK